MKKKYLLLLVLPALLLLIAFHQKQTQTDFEPVTPAVIEQRLQASAVKEVHPRLFFSKTDIDRVKKLHTEGDVLVKMGYNDLLEEANSVLKEPLLEYYLDDAKLRVPSVHKFATQVPSLVMAYQLTGDTMYAARAWKQLEKMDTYPDWGANRHFLDAGIGAFDFALAYDGLYTYLNSNQKKILRDAVTKHVLTPGLEQLKNKTWWSTANHNWNGICNGGLIMASLALFEEDPSYYSQILALAINALPKYIRSFEPDGQSEEGLMYWSYGLMYTTITFESMKRVMNTAFKLDQMPGFLKTGWFPAYMSGPVTSLSIGDDPVKKERSRSFFWFAKNNNDTALAQLQYTLCRETKKVTWMDLLYYDKGMCEAPKLSRTMNTDQYIRGIEVMSLRTGWDKNDWFVSMHGGHNNANHGHLDAGTFDLQALGEVWAYSNLGRDDYTYPGYFSKKTIPDYFDKDTAQSIPGRWHFYRLRAEGKNCLVFNPTARPDQNEQGEAKVKRSASGSSKAFYILDLSSCYNRDVTSYQRGILLHKASKVITIQDEWKAKENKPVWWQMHTRAAIRFTNSNRTAILKQNGKEIAITIQAPANVSFRELAADYLPGQSFPLTRNSSNAEYKKLAVQLNAAAQTICITVAPLHEKQNLKVKVIKMEKW